MCEPPISFIFPSFDRLSAGPPAGRGEAEAPEAACLPACLPPAYLALSLDRIADAAGKERERSPLANSSLSNFIL